MSVRSEGRQRLIKSLERAGVPPSSWGSRGPVSPPPEVFSLHPNAGPVARELHRRLSLRGYVCTPELYGSGKASNQVTRILGRWTEKGLVRRVRLSNLWALPIVADALDKVLDQAASVRVRPTTPLDAKRRATP